MRHCFLKLMCGLAVLLASPALALAEEEEKIPARLQNYDRAVAVDGSIMLSWLVFGFLAVVCIAVLFKNARRTHLD